MNQRALLIARGDENVLAQIVALDEELKNTKLRLFGSADPDGEAAAA